MFEFKEMLFVQVQLISLFSIQWINAFIAETKYVQ